MRICLIQLHANLAILAASDHCYLPVLEISVRKTIDLIIGTFCIARGYNALTANRDIALAARQLGLLLV